MPEQHHHLVNKCEDIVNLRGANAYFVATCTPCLRHVVDVRKIFARLTINADARSVCGSQPSCLLLCFAHVLLTSDSNACI